MTSVALLHYSCPPVVGGVEEVLRRQAHVLAQHGHDVRLIAGEGGTPAPGEPLGWGSAAVHIHPLLASGAADAGSSTEPAELDRLARRVEAVLVEALDGCDVVLAHNVLSMPFNLPLTLALRRIAARDDHRLPRVVGWNHDSPYFYPSYQPRLDEEPWRVLRMPHPDIHWVTISEARADDFGRLYGGFKPEVVQNGIDPHSFLKLEPSTSALVREERLFEADLVLMQPSRLHPRKNIELSLRVLLALLERGLDARLLVTGAHDPHDPAAAGYSRELQELVRELEIGHAVVVLSGHVLADGSTLSPSQVAIRDLYQVADVLFLPSRSEGFGLPVLEAGLIRLPVACADIPVLREISGDHAYRFALGSPPGQIAEGLLDYLDKLPPHELYRRVVERHTWEHLYATRLRPLLQRLTR